ncbi:Gfo/Idh/MocA family oxidoreductase, partial [Candidatus Neomarinimicrobiota bacterium]
ALINKALDAVAAAGVKMQIGFNRRFDPDFRRVREAVDSGAIGDVHMVRVIARDPEPPNPEYVASSGGMFLDMTIHDFDMVRYLSGLEVEEVYAVGTVLIDPAIGAAGDIDTAITTLRLTGGALAVIDNSRQAVYGYDQRVEVFGSKGSITAGNLTPTRTSLMTKAGVVVDKPLYFFLERYQESFRIEMAEFIQAILNNTATPVDGAAGLLSIQVGLAAKASLDQGVPIQVDYS